MTIQTHLMTIIIVTDEEEIEGQEITFLDEDDDSECDYWLILQFSIYYVIFYRNLLHSATFTNY